MEDIRTIIDEFKKVLLHVDRQRATELLDRCYAKPDGLRYVEAVVTRALEDIGLGWENATYSLAQVYMAGVICEQAMQPYLQNGMTTLHQDLPTIAIGILLDQHALGKKIVASILRASGYSIIDLGQGLTPEEMVEKALLNRVDVLLISTLMLSSARRVAEVRTRLNAAKADMTIIVGGAPFRLDKRLWRQVGADYKGDSASDAIALLKEVCER